MAVQIKAQIKKTKTQKSSLKFSLKESTLLCIFINL